MDENKKEVIEKSNRIPKKYLPIGTVVSLYGGSKRLMITGFYMFAESDPKKPWDYNACLYPEGVLSSERTYLFNHEQIEKVYYLGFSNDPEEKSYKKALREFIKNSLNNGNDNINSKIKNDSSKNKDAIAREASSPKYRKSKK